MLEVVINRGIPRSGKSTFAKKWVLEAPNRARVNRDDIRMQLYGQEFGGIINEGVVTKVQHSMIRTLLNAGISVIVDDCNITEKYVTTFTNIAKEFGAAVSLNVVDTPLKVALARNLACQENGERYVPEHVIIDMYNRMHPED